MHMLLEHAPRTCFSALFRPKREIITPKSQVGRYILGRLRGETGADEGRAEAEFQDIRNIVELENKTSSQQSYMGIAGITIYGPTIFSIAGISPERRQWVAGLNDITYMFSTLLCVFTLDKIGRRWTLYWGSVGQGICMFVAGGLARATINAAPNNKAGVGGAATFFVFLFTAIFGATWLTVPWLYPAEIFPLQNRAKGNAWGVIGWSVGNGWTVLLLPTMFKALEEKSLYVFGAVNAATFVIVWALYPETNQRTLEEMNLVFAADSICNWEAEKNYKLLKEQNPELVQAAQRGHSVADPETGAVRSGSLIPHNMSLDAKAYEKHDSDGSEPEKL